MGQRIAAFLAATFFATTAALAVKPGAWTFTTEAEFQAAEVDHTVVTNLGKVQLSRAVDMVAELGDEDSIVYDFAQTADEQVFIAVGPAGKLARLADDKIETLAEFDGEQVFALAAVGGDLWVAVSGANSRLERRNPAKPDEVVTTIALKDTRYVWDIVALGDKLAVATGTEGKVLIVDPANAEAEPVVALDTEQPNVLCLAAHGNKLYAGTDGEGLVYRVSPTGDDDEPYHNFIVYDAAEPEIGALLVGTDGVVYAGTADAEQARPGRLAEVVEEETGEPDADGAGEAEPADDDGQPQPAPDDAADQPQPGDADNPADAGEQPGNDAAPAPKPTAEQYDALRAEIRKRLAAAAKGKQWVAKAGGKQGGKKPGRRADAGRAANGSASEEGNAVYAIDADGFVRTIFRESAMILSITEHNGKLLIATGNEGEVYRVDPANEEVTVIADLDAEQIPAVYVLNGKALLGTANPGQVHYAAEGFAESGTYTCDPLDATQISKWGKMSVVFDTPRGTKLAVETRSGNVEDPEAGSWSKWSASQDIAPAAEGEPVYVDVDSPPARFLQYRLTLSSGGDATPTISDVRLAYVMPNMKPKIASITAKYPDDEEGPKTTVKLEWEAADPNEDALTYTLEARRMGDDSPFVELDAEIEENSYEWDTRSMPDGRYEVRLVASDAADNVPGQSMVSRRVTAQVVVDNTAPQAKLTAEPAGPGRIAFSATCTDALSRVTDVRYAVNGAKEWKMLLPEDLIYDSTAETVGATISDLAPGNAVLALRVTDALGNSRYVSQTVKVAP